MNARRMNAMAAVEQARLAVKRGAADALDVVAYAERQWFSIPRGVDAEREEYVAIDAELCALLPQPVRHASPTLTGSATKP